jgi:hypothetical protein
LQFAEVLQKAKKEINERSKSNYSFVEVKDKQIDEPKESTVLTWPVTQQI